jgi:hypothetical protein
MAAVRGIGRWRCRSPEPRGCTATALGTAPATLYRYVASRGVLVELVIDRVVGDGSYDALGGDWRADLVARFIPGLGALAWGYRAYKLASGGIYVARTMSGARYVGQSGTRLTTRSVV